MDASSSQRIVRDDYDDEDDGGVPRAFDTREIQPSSLLYDALSQWSDWMMNTMTIKHLKNIERVAYALDYIGRTDKTQMIDPFNRIQWFEVIDALLEKKGALLYDDEFDSTTNTYDALFSGRFFVDRRFESRSLKRIVWKIAEIERNNVCHPDFKIDNNDDDDDDNVERHIPIRMTPLPTVAYSFFDSILETIRSFCETNPDDSNVNDTFDGKKGTRKRDFDAMVMRRMEMSTPIDPSFLEWYAFCSMVASSMATVAYHRRSVLGEEAPMETLFESFFREKRCSQPFDYIVNAWFELFGRFETILKEIRTRESSFATSTSVRNAVGTSNIDEDEPEEEKDFFSFRWLTTIPKISYAKSVNIVVYALFSPRSSSSSTCDQKRSNGKTSFASIESGTTFSTHSRLEGNIELMYTYTELRYPKTLYFLYDGHTYKPLTWVRRPKTVTRVASLRTKSSYRKNVARLYETTVSARKTSGSTEPLGRRVLHAATVVDHTKNGRRNDVSRKNGIIVVSKDRTIRWSTINYFDVFSNRRNESKTIVGLGSSKSSTMYMRGLVDFADSSAGTYRTRTFSYEIENHFKRIARGVFEARFCLESHRSHLLDGTIFEDADHGILTFGNVVNFEFEWIAFETFLSNDNDVEKYETTVDCTLQIRNEDEITFSDVDRVFFSCRSKKSDSKGDDIVDDVRKKKRNVCVYSEKIGFRIGRSTICALKKSNRWKKNDHRRRHRMIDTTLTWKQFFDFFTVSIVVTEKRIE